MYPFFKRVLDLAAALGVLALLAPALPVLWMAVALSMGRPALFRQERSGKEGRPFLLYKFRSMTSARDREGKLLPDEFRLTRLGRFLRQTSLDELPQLFNVIRGEMSLVGPRPLYHSYLERYSPEQRRRLEVMPGITGLAQINGRNAISWEEKFKLDVEYVDRRCFAMDLAIMARTVIKVLGSRDIAQEGRSTVDEFMGTERRQS